MIRFLRHRWIPLTATAAVVLTLALSGRLSARDTGNDDGFERTSAPYGAWEIEAAELSGTTVETVMTIEPNRIRLTRRCFSDRYMVQVEASSSVEITFDTMRILDTDVAEQGHGPASLDCKVSLSPKTLTYSIRDVELRLFDPQRHETLVLTRREL